MPRPNLIHPIQTTIERLARDELVMDEGAREPVHGVRTTASQTYILPAQVQWDAVAAPDANPEGIVENDSGYILVRTFDLDRLIGTGQRLKRGDRIVAMGVRTGLDLYLTGKELPMGHHPDQLGQTLIRYYFESRRPVRSSVTETVEPGGTPQVAPAAPQDSGEQSFSWTWLGASDSNTVMFPTAMTDASYIVEATLTDPNGGPEAQLRMVRATRTTTQVVITTTGGETLVAGAIIDIVLRDE